MDGARFLERVVAQLRGEIEASGKPPPALGTIVVANDRREMANARRKHLSAEDAGMQFRHVQLSDDAQQQEVERAVDALAADPAVHGVFVQLPLPAHIEVSRVLDRIPPSKDIDGLCSASLGRLLRGEEAHVPATPSGIVQLLSFYGIDVERKRIVVVGRTPEVARALTLLCIQRGAAVVTVVDPDAGALAETTRVGDIVVSAAQRPALITRESVALGAAVVDAAANRTAWGIVGDVDERSIEGHAGALAPMPGGIGPATIAALLQNTWAAARAQR